MLKSNLKKQLKLNVKKMLINESKEINKNSVDRWKAISEFLSAKCLACDSVGSTTLHLQILSGNRLLQRAESKKLGYIVITTSDVQIYARQCHLKFGIDSNFCTLSW